MNECIYGISMVSKALLKLSIYVLIDENKIRVG